ncbi:hypothetical protein FA13DRAFT_1711334 [Coprinellus micaceus]|uniref:Uncharacterized protein n=1 Tax=Coprinellus micaceus TaxID=71717 RepID=A0A4Y7T443_COPMI|nr:hypothetical protein FA13DRAFT_1711334 [Coprinellus micaceus]
MCHHEGGHTNAPGQTSPQHLRTFTFAEGSAMFAVRHHLGTTGHLMVRDEEQSAYAALTEAWLPVRAITGISAMAGLGRERAAGDGSSPLTVHGPRLLQNPKAGGGISTLLALSSFGSNGGMVIPRRTRSFLLWPSVLSHPDLRSVAITGLATGLPNNEMQTGLPNCIIPEGQTGACHSLGLQEAYQCESDGSTIKVVYERRRHKVCWVPTFMGRPTPHLATT